MSPIELLIIAGIALICGSVGQLTSGYSRGGWIVNLIIAFMGALLGVYISRTVNAPEIVNIKSKTLNFPVIYALVGSVLCVAFMSMFVKPGKR